MQERGATPNYNPVHHQYALLHKYMIVVLLFLPCTNRALPSDLDSP